MFGFKVFLVRFHLARIRVDFLSFSWLSSPELGDVTQIKTVAEELKSRSEAFASFSDKFIQLAEDFDFEGISKLVSELEKIAKSG